QSAASSFIGGRSAQGSAGGERALDGLAGNVSSTTRGQGARLGRRIDVGSRGHSRIPVIPSLTRRRCRPTRTFAPSSSVLIYSPAPAAGVQLSPRSARALPPSSRSRLPVGVLHEPDAISVAAFICAAHRPERPCCRRAAEQRDELAAFQLIELHSIPASEGRIAGYRIGKDQSAGGQKRLYKLQSSPGHWRLPRWVKAVPASNSLAAATGKGAFWHKQERTSGTMRSS